MWVKLPSLKQKICVEFIHHQPDRLVKNNFIVTTNLNNIKKEQVSFTECTITNYFGGYLGSGISTVSNTPRFTQVLTYDENGKLLSSEMFENRDVFNRKFGVRLSLMRALKQLTNNGMKLNKEDRTVIWNAVLNGGRYNKNLSHEENNHVS